MSVAERVRALNELGLLGKETGRLDEARACYLEALSMVPPDSAEAASWHDLGEWNTPAIASTRRRSRLAGRS